VEGPKLGRVLAHRGQEQPVRAGLLEGELGIALDLRDVGGEQGLGAGAVEVDRIAGRSADRDREAMPEETGLELSVHGCGGAANDLGVLPGEEDHELAIVGLERLPSRRDVTRRDLLSDRQRDLRGQRRPVGPAHAAGRQHQNPRSPVSLLRLVVVRADDDDASPLAQVRAELLAPGHDVLPVGGAPVEDVGEEGGHRRVARPLGAARALDVEGDQGPDHAQQRGGRTGAASAVAKLSDDRVGHAKVQRVRPLATRQHHALVLGRGASNGQDRPGDIDDRDARVQGATRRAGDVGQPGPRFDGRGHLGGGLEERAPCVGVRTLGACRHRDDSRAVGRLAGLAHAGWIRRS
jgi:hypothetical protein